MNAIIQLLLLFVVICVIDSSQAECQLRRECVPWFHYFPKGGRNRVIHGCTRLSHGGVSTISSYGIRHSPSCWCSTVRRFHEGRTPWRNCLQFPTDKIHPVGPAAPHPGLGGPFDILKPRPPVCVLPAMCVPQFTYYLRLRGANTLMEQLKGCTKLIGDRRQSFRQRRLVFSKLERCWCSSSRVFVEGVTKRIRCPLRH